jgi:hypothetical protein
LVNFRDVRDERETAKQSEGRERGAVVCMGGKQRWIDERQTCGPVTIAFLCSDSFSYISQTLFFLVNMVKSTSFQRNGKFALQFVQYYLVKAAEAIDQGLKPSRGDYSWKTFQQTHSSIVEACCNAHPGGASERSRSRVTQNNYGTQLKRSKDWLQTGKGSDYLLFCFV